MEEKTREVRIIESYVDDLIRAIDNDRWATANQLGIELQEYIGRNYRIQIAERLEKPSINLE